MKENLWEELFEQPLDNHIEMASFGSETGVGFGLFFFFWGDKWVWLIFFYLERERGKGEKL